MFFMVTYTLPFFKGCSSAVAAVSQSAGMGKELWPIKQVGMNCCSFFAFSAKMEFRNSSVSGFK